MEQTALGISTTHSIAGDIRYSVREKEILRELAKQVAELAAHPREDEKKKLWFKLNDLQPVRPLVFCDPKMVGTKLLPKIRFCAKNHFSGYGKWGCVRKFIGLQKCRTTELLNLFSMCLIVIPIVAGGLPRFILRVAMAVRMCGMRL